MRNHFKLLVNAENRRLTLLLLALAIIVITIGLIIGISDNPPGIIILYTGIILLIISLVYIWRKIRPFLILLVVSIIGVPVFAVLHNIFYGIAELTSDVKILPEMLNIFDAISFLIALIICPSGIIVGMGGALILFIKRKKSKVNLSS